MRKYIVIGVGEFDISDDPDGEDFFDTDELEPLDFVEDKARNITIALREAGLTPIGTNPILHPSHDELKKALKEARKGSTQNGSVIHYIGHGLANSELGTLHLPARDTNLEELGDTSIDTGALINAIESNRRGPQVLLFLDVCNAGEVTRTQALNLLHPSRRKTWVIGASTRGENAFKARFTEAVTRTLKRLKEGWLDIHPSLKYVPIETIASEIGLSLNRICSQDHAALPQSLTVTPRTELHDSHPPFFENPSYQLTPQARLLMRAEAEVREFAEQLDEGLDAIHFATRATGLPHQTRMSSRCFFAGREAQLAELSRWMDKGTGSTLRVVTGSPGAGKSALIGVLVCLAHPDLYEATPSVASKIPSHLHPSCNESFAAVHARGRDLQQILNSIARQLNISHPEGDQLTSAHLIQGILQADTDPVVVVDALDEAVRPVDVMSNLLLPLSNARGIHGESACRVLIGMRPWSQFDVLLKAADGNDGLINLDQIPSSTVEKDLKQYVIALLRNQPFYRSAQQREASIEIAESIARVLSHKDVVGAFLIAGLFVHQIGTELTHKTVTEISTAIPRSLPEMLELHLAQLGDQNRRWIRPVMAALAHAKGEGMPATVIQAAAAAFVADERFNNTTAAAPTDQDVSEVLAATSFYLRHSVDMDGRTLYRLVHQALADHLLNYPLNPTRRTRDKTSDAVALLRATRSLIEHPDTQEAGFQRNLWSAAPPYLLRHAIQHALDGGDVDILLLDSEFLVHSDPSTLLKLLGYARSPEARLAAAVYRTSAIRHSQVNALARRRILCLDASRFGAGELLAALQSDDNVSSGPAVHFTWATGGELKESFDHDFDGHTAAITDLSAAAIRGNMTVISASEDGSLRVCDLRGGWTLAHLENSHTDWILALKTIDVGGNPILVTASVDHKIMGWDFSSAHVDSFIIGRHRDWIRALVVHEMDERPIVVSGGDDHELRVWDLSTQEMIGDPLIGHKGPVHGLAIGRIGGNSLAVSSSRDGEVIVWDLSTRKIVKRFVPFQADWVRSIAIPEGRREAYLASDAGYLSVWDLSGFEEISHSSVLPFSGIRALDMAVVDGESMAITCGINGEMMMWDRQASPIPFPYAFKGFQPYTLSTSSLEGQPLALIGGRNGTVLSLSLASDEDLGTPWLRSVDEQAPWMMDDEREGILQAVTIGDVGGRPVVYTGDNSGAVSQWRFELPSQSDVPVYGHRHDSFALYSVSHPSGDLLITSSSYGTITICDLASGSPLHNVGLGSTLSGIIRHFAVKQLSDHVKLVIGASGELSIWDIENPTDPLHTYPEFRDTVTAIEVAEHETTAVCVTGHVGGTIRFWDLNRPELIGRKPRAHRQLIRSIVKVDAPERLRVASVAEDASVCVWDCSSSERVATYKVRDARPTCVASVFTKKLNLMTVGYEDGCLDFLDPLTGQKITESIVFPFSVNAVDIDQSGNMAACFSRQIAFMHLGGI